MIVYNVTIQVQHDVHALWLQWLKNEHIPEMMALGIFDAYRILRLLETDESEGMTYAVQYQLPSKALYNLYIEKYSTQMRDKSFARWGDKFIAFRTVMEIVD